MVQDAAAAIVWFEHESVLIENGAASGFAEPIAPMTRLAVPVFLTVTVCVAEDPDVTLPKGTLRSVVGETESVTEIAGTGAAAPSPLTLTVTVLFVVSLLGREKLSENVPVAAGAKTTVMVQDAETAIVWFEHESVLIENGDASGFAEPAAPMTRLAVPVFLTVTVCVAEDPDVTLPKGTLKSVVGETESETVIAGAEAPATVKELVATISSPWLGLFGSAFHFEPKKAPDLSYLFPYHEALKV
jgi:hypothetical protein